ncbi:recombinase family protein [Virgibacillus sp. DJP39]|uniref:recombinase family protein n=1 Tax=Virgibacillus sp. DJP39 TaxID=3409790 RepID=UPI003BB5426B
MSDQTSDNAKSIALYCRVSTDEQAREGISLGDQQVRLKAYCKAMGWSDMPLLFVDDGYSAKNLERPQLMKLIAEVEKENISKVLVTKLDRMSRYLKDLLDIIELCQGLEVSFVSIGESFDTNTSSGRLTLQVLGAVAEFERERIRERVIENMLHGVSQGKWMTQSPYGYELIDKKLVINEIEAKVVKRVFDYYINKGWGFYSIAKKLNEEGVPSKQKKQWSIRSIKLMLMNPAYKGTLVWNRVDRSAKSIVNGKVDRSKKKTVEKDKEKWVTVDNAHPSIIEEITWDAAQNKITKQKKSHPRSKTSPHLLGGFLKCGRCGAGMSISWHGPQTNRRRVYRCSANKNKGTCTSKYYPAQDVEDWFKQGLLQLSESFDESYVLRLADQVQEDQQSEITKQIHNAKNRYNRKVEAYTAGLIEIDDLKNEKEKMEKILEEAESQETTTYVDISALEEKLNQKIGSVIDAIDTIPVVEAKSLIQTLVEKVVLYEEKNIEVVLSIPS